MKLCGKALIGLGLFLVLCGVAGYMSNPEGAKTALLSGGVFGGLVLLLGVAVLQGLRLALYAALGLLGLLELVFFWRAAVGWMGVADGNEEKIFAASLITAMLVATLAAGLVLLRTVFLQKQETPDHEQAD